MKPTGIADDAMAHHSMWSAPISEIPPGCSAKFHILWRERLVEGFVVNFDGRYYAYVNYCIHSRFLVCGTHGSLYEPDSGKCAGGPCGGGTLFPLQVQVTGDRIVVTAT